MLDDVMIIPKGALAEQVTARVLGKHHIPSLSPGLAGKLFEMAKACADKSTEVEDENEAQVLAWHAELLHHIGGVAGCHAGIVIDQLKALLEKQGE